MKLNKDLVKQILPLLVAYNRGEELQFQYTDNDDWTNIDDIAFETLAEYPERYRIKPKVEYRPFNSARECFEEMQKHTNGTWFKSYLSSAYFQVVMVTELGIKDGNGDFTSFENAVHRYRFLDGSNFGIKVKD